MARYEMVGHAPEFDGKRARLHLLVCASSPKGEPIGDFYEVAVSPWFDIEDEAGAMRWFYDWYRERQGFAHPEDPRGGSAPGKHVAVLVADLVTGEARVHREVPHGRSH